MDERARRADFGVCFVSEGRPPYHQNTQRTSVEPEGVLAWDVGALMVLLTRRRWPETDTPFGT